MLRKKSIMVLRKQCLYVLRALSEALSRTESRKALTVCVVGAGDVGKEIADEILASGIDPSNIFMTARDPDSLASYAQLGILCTSDNAEACHRSRLIFLCCAPSHLATVARSMRLRATLLAALLHRSRRLYCQTEKCRKRGSGRTVLRGQSATARWTHRLLRARI